MSGMIIDWSAWKPYPENMLDVNEMEAWRRTGKCHIEKGIEFMAWGGCDALWRAVERIRSHELQRR